MPINTPIKFASMSFMLYTPNFNRRSNTNSLNNPTNIVTIVAMNIEFVKVNNTTNISIDKIMCNDLSGCKKSSIFFIRFFMT